MKYIVSIDQSTSASKAFLIDAQGDIVRRASRPHRQFYPAPDRVEQDAEEIFQNVAAVIDEVTDGIPSKALSALAITNQRETTVLWDRETGLPVCPAVVWQDTRGAALCQALSAWGEMVERTTGSALSPYLPASKIGVLLNERPDLRRRAEAGDIAMGTVESYPSYVDAVQALLNGKVDCVLIDGAPADVFVAENEGLQILESAYTVESYAIAISKDNVELLGKVTAALQDLIADGTVDAIIEKYIPADEAAE